MSSEELKPCPFCGSAAQVRAPGDSDGFPLHIGCRCGAQLYGGKSHFGEVSDAVSVWNTRAQPEVQRLREALEEIRHANMNGPISESNAGCIKRIEQIAERALAASTGQEVGK